MVEILKDGARDCTQINPQLKRVEPYVLFANNANHIHTSGCGESDPDWTDSQC